MSGSASSKVRGSFSSIEKVSVNLLIESANAIIADNKYNLDWDEEQFSAHIISNMNKQDFTEKYNLHIHIETKLLNEDKLPIKGNNPKYLPRIDISIASWLFKKGEKEKYFFEAKNLYENNYKQKIASQYLNRYIDTGIENFRTNKYTNGSLIGYVLNGEVIKVVNKLNIQLKKDRKKYKASNCLRELEKIDLTRGYSSCYESVHYRDENENLEIKHIFLSF